MIRFGLCCKFDQEPIRFRTTTAKFTGQLSKKERNAKLADLCRTNAHALLAAIRYCSKNDIGSFRVNSQILPLKTHPDLAYDVAALPGGREIIDLFCACGQEAVEKDIRLTFHPDQFILLSSPHDEVIRKSVEELEYQAAVSEWIGADVINIHGGGAYGDKASALAKVKKTVRTLSKRIRMRLTFENDDRIYTPEDLLPLCAALSIPLVYDVHHHRCLPDGLTINAATEAVLSTWNREPLFHISSSREGWKSKTPHYHHDYIDPKDFPVCWRGLDITVEVEAKAKEKAVKRLQKQLQKKDNLYD